VSPWKPLRGSSPPRRLGDSLDRISRSLGGPPAGALAAIFAQWPTIVGAPVAAHAEPLSLVRGTLTIGVDQSGWATQLTYLEADLVRRIGEVVGVGAVQRVRVTVRPK
jgi:predicted nucleic acid-binding Zn ribbon protein